MPLGSVLLIALVVGYLWSQKVRQDRLRESAQRRATEEKKTESLATLEVEMGEGLFREWWRFHFPTMQLRVTSAGATTSLTTTTLNFRRTNNGEWEQQLHESEVEAAVHFGRIRYLGDPKDPDYVQPSDDDKVQWVGKEREIRSRLWWPLPSDIAPRLETHYQRFLRHYET